MSFADELRNAPEQVRQKEKQQKEKDLETLITLWYKSLKKGCLAAAKAERNSYIDYLSDYVGRLNEEYFVATNKAWWDRISSRIKCPLNPKFSQLTVCLDENDVEQTIAQLKKCFAKDGLSVEFEKKEKQKYCYKSVWVERSTSDRVAIGIFNLLTSSYEDDEGRYVQKKVEDGFRYDLKVKLSW